MTEELKLQSAQSARGAIFTAFVGTSLSSVLVTALTFISGVLIARALGPEGRADYGSVLLIAQTAAALGCLSFFDASVVHLQRRGGDATHTLPTMITMALTLSALATGATLLVSPLMEVSLTDVSQEFLAFVCFMIITTQLLIQCFSSLERSQLNFLMINVERVGAPAAFSLLIAITWLFYGTALTATAAVSLFVIGKLPVILLWLGRYRKHLIGPFSWGLSKGTLRTGLKFHVAMALGAVASQLDRLIAVSAWPKELLGHYFVAFSAVGAGYSVITTAMNTVLLPYLGGLATVHRSEKISQIIRLTLIVTALAVSIGWLIIPYALPLLYGSTYVPAVDIALWMLLAFSVLPLRTIVLETGRSLGKGRPSTEMAITSIATMYAGYLITGFNAPSTLITCFGLSHLLSTLVGARHMLLDGDLRFNRTLLPTLDDLQFIKSIFLRAARHTNK